MFRLSRKILILGSLAALIAGCGANVNGYGQVDAYGNPINPYGAGYGSEYGSTGDPYGGSYGGDTYGGGSYSGDTGGSYDGTTGGSYDSGSDYGSGSDTYTGASPSPSPSAGTNQGDAGSLDDRPVLSAYVLEVKESGVLGMGKIICKVEVENPGNTTLSGKLRVLFTDNGDPTANAITKRVTLKPKEKQVHTFTAKAWRLDDAEASVETDEPKPSQSEAVQ